MAHWLGTDWQPMFQLWAQWGVAWALNGCLLLVALLVSLRLLERWPPELRRRLLTVAALLMLIMPLAGALLPPLQLPLPSAGLFSLGFPKGLQKRPLIEESDRPPDAGLSASQTRLVTSPVERGSPSNRNDQERVHAIPAQSDSAVLPSQRLHSSGGSSLDFSLAAFWVWVAGLLAVASAWAVSAWRMSCIMKQARPVRNPLMRRLGGDLAARLGLARPPVLLVSPHVHSPLVCGMLRPAVIFPSRCEDWSREKKRMVLCHELQHVAARDLPWQTLTLALCVLHWFNPLAWMLHRRLCIEQERCCDRSVIGMGEDPSCYADLLLRSSMSLQRDAVHGGVRFLKRFCLRDRLFEVLRMRAHPPQTPSRTLRAAPWALALLIAGPLSVVRTQDSDLGKKAAARNPDAPGSESLKPEPPWLEPRLEFSRRGRSAPIASQMARVIGEIKIHRYGSMQPLLPGLDKGVRHRSQSTGLASPNVPPSAQGSDAPPWIRVLKAPVTSSPRMAWRHPTFLPPTSKPSDGGSAEPVADPAPEPEPEAEPAPPPPDDSQPEEPPRRTRLVPRSVAIPSLGGTTAAASDISDNGIVVGSSSLPSGAVHPFQWTRESGTVDLGLPDGWLSAWAERVNSRGEVLVGGVRRAGALESSLFLWSPQEGYSPVGALPGCELIEKADLNATGEVVGLCDLGYRKSSFFWSRSTGIIDLGWLESGPLANRDTLPVGLNARGQIAGTSGPHAFIWSLEDGLRALPVDGLEALIGEPVASSRAYSLNDAGVVAGSVFVETGSRAVLWRDGGEVTLIEPLHPPSGPGMLRVLAEALAVNENGEVLGRSLALQEDEEGHRRLLSAAFLWNAQDGVREVSDLKKAAAGFGSLHGHFTERRQLAGQVRVDRELLYQAMLWTPEDGMFIFDVWEGHEISDARAVNRAGQVVGWGSGFDPQTNRRTTPLQAFLWELVEVDDQGGQP